MKRLIKFLGLLCVMFALVFSACGGNGTQTPPDDNPNLPSEKTVVVSALKQSISIGADEVSAYDYTVLFSITEDGKEVQVLASYIDASAVKAEAGEYTVTCTYQDKHASVSVTVTEPVYELKLSVQEVSVKLAALKDTDFTQYFTATKDGKKEAVSEDMVTSDVKEAVGNYSFTVTYHGQTQTLTVHVVPDHEAEVVLSTASPEIPVNKIATYDLTSLFSLYMDGVAVKVTSDMIHADGFLEAKAGDTVEVTLDYSANGITAHGSVTVKIVEEIALVITPKNIVTYPNAEAIDLTTLFTIEEGGEEIPVTIDMIEGSIDYSEEGENNIVLSYEGKSATAVVTVKLGVIIDYVTSDTVTVKLGTDKASYPFADDFFVIINGERFRNIPDSCLNVEEVNFGQEGSYTATITVRYNDEPKTGGLLGTYPAKEFSKEITYVVVSAAYELSLKEELLLLPVGTTSYDFSKNLNLSVDGTNQGFTTRKDYADPITVYYEVLEDLDYTSPEIQTVRLALYVYGVEKDPVEVEFDVQIRTEVSVSSADRIVFTGETLYTRDLFEVTENGAPVEVLQEYISGKVDTFTPGVYIVTLNYKGVVAQTRVVVYERDLIGTYRTPLTTIPVEEEDDDDEGGGWGDEYGSEWMAVPLAAAGSGVSPLGALTINEDGTMRFNGTSVYSVTGIDENTMILHTGYNGAGRDYTLHYDNGIVVLDVDNSIRLKFSDSARPLLYFKSDLWQMQEHIVVNDGQSYILQTHYAGRYSIDMARVKGQDETELWYAIYVGVLESVSSNTSYEVKWGEVTFESEFSRDADAENTMLFEGERYTFKMTDSATGVIVHQSTSPFAGKNFTGTIDGKAAVLQAGSSDRYELFIENKSALQVLSNEYNNMKHGGVLSATQLLLYGLDFEKYGTFSYLFTLDTAENTFVLEERDSYFGVYRRGDMLLFLDGYGKGNFYESYDGRNYSSTEVSYTVKNSEMQIFFTTYDPNYAYGKEAAFYVSPLLNVLTAKSSKNNIFSGEPFENTLITDGAIVRVTVTSLPSNSRSQLFNGVRIVTKDGELTQAQKESVIDVTTVDFSHSGFYRFSVKINVRGEEVVSYYTVQIFAESYKNNPLATNSYGSGGVIYGLGFSLSIDTYGRASVSTGGATYSGTVQIFEENKSFVIKAYNSNFDYVCVKGTVLADGIIRAECSGMLHYTDYFVFSGGSSQVAGTSGYVLRRLTYGENSVYIASTNDKSAGEVVQVSVDGDGIYTITQGDGVRRAQITWGNDSASGLTFLED